MVSSSFYAGKLIVVTGASSGIGRALATKLSGEGASVALVGRDSGRLAAAVQAGGERARSYKFDLADGAGIQALIDRIQADFGRPIDIAVHAAGAAAVGNVEDTPIQVMQEIVVTNLVAAMGLAHAVLPGMRARRTGLLVFLSSGVANYGVPGEAAYSASKAGVERLSESLRAELAGSGVGVCVVSPGPVETPLMRNPRRYGNLTLVGRPAAALAPDLAAKKIVARLSLQAQRIELSFRGPLVRHLTYWAPAVLGRLLARQAGARKDP